MKSKPVIWDAWLLTFIVLEHLFLYFTYPAGLSQDANSTAYVLSSILFGGVLLYKFYNKPKLEMLSADNTRSFYRRSVPAMIVAGGLAFLFVGYRQYFSQMPIDARFSDIIPLIQIACKRLLTGQYPYALVKDFGYDMDMTYLPAQWMPFLPGVAFNFDVRWVSIAAMAMASVVLSNRAFSRAATATNYAIAIIIVAAQLVVFEIQPGIAGVTVELLISAYYMCLIAALNSNATWAHIITLSLCLLSRFSLVLWMPLYFIVLFINKEHRKSLYTAIGIATVTLLVYVIPFLAKDPMIFIKAYTYYDKGSLHEWTTNGDGNKPTTLFSGTGFAYAIYYNFKGMATIAQIQLAKKIHLVACLVTTALLSAWYWRNRERIDKKVFLMGSLKIYLAVFLYFVQIPYLYLMCVSNFLSIAIFSEQARLGWRGVAPRSRITETNSAHSTL